MLFMGEWSEFFEDFPEFNPANDSADVRTQVRPPMTLAERAKQVELHQTIQKMIEAGQQRAKAAGR